MQQNTEAHCNYSEHNQIQIIIIIITFILPGKEAHWDKKSLLQEFTGLDWQ